MVVKNIFASLKHHPSLIPLFVFVSLGVGGAIFYPLRCAFKSPDVTWDRKNNPEPWNEYRAKHYKFYTSPAAKKAVTESPAPVY